MHSRKTPTGRDCFVLASQQALALAVVAALGATAAGVVDLRLVTPADGAHGAHADAATGGAGTGGAGSLVSAEPVTPSVRTISLAGASLDGMQVPGAQSGTPARPTQRISAISRPEKVTGFATVGVTWAHGERLAEDAITVSVRTKDQGRWSDWETMDYDADHGPDPGTAEAQAAARPGTDAVVVGDVDDVQVMAATDDGAAPEDLALAVIDPGADVAPTYQDPAIDTGALASASSTASSTATLAGSPADVTPKPQIFSRAQWGADEGMRDPGSLHYGEVHAGFVHHTVNANGYSRSDVPSILRGIYAYHTQSLGWSDVGYNYLVDRFGQIWEGRYGGVDRPVVGAHTLGYNDDAFAMSAIGNYDVTGPSKAMIRAYARLFAWKLSLHGVRADDRRQYVTSGTFQAINGHRDAGQTACPGRYLYDRIPDIRRRAAKLQHGFEARGRTADLSGRGWPDLVVRDRTSHHAVVIRTGGQLSFEHAATAARDWAPHGLVLAPGDLDGDGTADLMARDRGGRTRIFAGDGSGGLRAGRVSSRFSMVEQLTGVGDFDGDGHADLVGRSESTKALLLYPGTGRGGFSSSRTLAADWSTYNRTLGVDDLDGDGHVDLVARDGGTLVLVRGRGHGASARLGSRTSLPGDFTHDLVTGRGDATGDRVPDLVVRVAGSQKTWIYPGDGDGGLDSRVGGWSRFAGARWVALAGQVTGSRAADLVSVRRSSGDLKVSENTGRRNLGRTIDTGTVLDHTNLLVNVGDWDGDGHGDFMSRTRSGRMWFHAGRGRTRFADPVRAARDWSRVGLVAAVGDATGDGFPDLMGRDGDGDFRVYPGDGDHGFDRSYVAHSAIDARGQAGVGLFNRDGAPDVVLRRSDGTLWLWTGNGPGGLVSGSEVASGLRRYNWARGYGDLDGDGRADLVVRSRGNGKLWLLPGSRSGFGDRRLIGTGFGGYDRAG